MTQGGRANKSGNVLEKNVEAKKAVTKSAQVRKNVKRYFFVSNIMTPQQHTFGYLTLKHC